MLNYNGASLTPTQRFWRLLKPDRSEIRNVYVYAIFSGLISLSLPLGIQAIINLIQGGQISTSWIVLVTFVVLGVALTGVLQIYQLRITENLQQRIFTRAAFEFAYRIPRIKMEQLYKHFAPELMNRFFDTINVQKGLSKILIDFSTALLYVIFGLILLSFYHPFFILFSLLLIMLVYFIFRFTAQQGLGTSLQESKYKYKVAHWLEELARTSITFRLGGNNDLPLQRTDALVSSYLTSRESHFKILVRQFSLLVGFKVIVATGLLALGGILVMEQRMNIGQFVAAEIIILTVMSSVEKLILAMETIYDVLTGLEKIGQVTDMELENSEGMCLEEYTQESGLAVDLRDVTFRYPGSDRNTLQNLDFAAKSGEKVMLSGPTGSGKSSLLHILAGLYETQHGIINYNGLPRASLQMASVRNVIGEVLDEGYLFEGSVLENITLGREVNLDQVRKVARQVRLSEYIENLPLGYQTTLLPQEVKLPRSVRQKILIARSIIHRPKLLLVEDLSTYLTREDYLSIMELLTSKSQPWTLVAISSDDELKDQFDKVFLLEENPTAQVVEVNTI